MPILTQFWAKNYLKISQKLHVVPALVGYAGSRRGPEMVQPASLGGRPWAKTGQPPDLLASLRVVFA